MKTHDTTTYRASSPRPRWRKRVLAQLQHHVPPCLVKDGWWLDSPSPQRWNRL